jgi:hypothetical protein
MQPEHYLCHLEERGTCVSLGLQLLGGIWIEARGGPLIAISSRTIGENKNLGFEVRCGWWHCSLSRHAPGRATITIVYRLYGEG